MVKSMLKSMGTFKSKSPPKFGRGFLWSQRSDLNRRPTDYESVALPLSYAGVLLDVWHTFMGSRDGM